MDWVWDLLLLWLLLVYLPQALVMGYSSVRFAPPAAAAFSVWNHASVTCLRLQPSQSPWLCSVPGKSSCSSTMSRKLSFSISPNTVGFHQCPRSDHVCCSPPHRLRFFFHVRERTERSNITFAPTIVATHALLQLGSPREAFSGYPSPFM